MTIAKKQARLLVVIAALSIPLAAQKTAQPIPDGFDFPADQSKLLAARDGQDVHAMRLHVWMVFAGLTQPTSSGEAIWETWYSAAETFSPAQAQALSQRKLQRRFQVPRQFQQAGTRAQAVGTSLASFTLFNADLRNWVQSKKLYLRSTLQDLNNTFGPQVPVDKRAIPDFPRTAVALKTVWWIVKRTGQTVMPIWDPDINSARPSGNDISTWQRCVVIDPSRSTVPNSETAEVSCNGRPTASAHTVALDSFYHFALTADQIQQLRQIATIPNIDQAEAGDFVALVAMHVTTKEIPDWVWATAWWHDRPNDGPFAADRPSQVQGVWRNYLMSEAYSMDTPKQSDDSPHIAFNPWLEARFVDGTTSNCMTCHRRSVFSGQRSDGNFLPITHGAPPNNDPRFTNSTKLDFLWSILFESH